MIEVEINGNNFSDMSGFYDEIETKLSKGMKWSIGRNLDAFNDVLRGGFGVHEYGEALSLTWTNSSKSEHDLGFAASARRYKSLLESCHPGNKKELAGLLAKAERKEGESLYETLLAMLGEHEHITFKTNP